LILVIDNYDSFTYNLVQYLGELGKQFPVAAEIQVYRNDQIDLATISKLNPDGIVISPGPGRPEDAGISLDLFRASKHWTSFRWENCFCPCLNARQNFRNLSF
jgi:anthranilate synthase component 2